MVTYQTSVSRTNTRARITLVFLFLFFLGDHSLARSRYPLYVRAHMGEVAHTAAAAVSSSFSPPVKEEEERYVQVGSRFFRMKPAGGAMTRPHFLDACFLCKKSISRDRDIFMYKGDAAFCGEECRQEQMCMDESLKAVARRHRVLQHHKPAMAEPVDGAARREVEASRSPPMMHRRPTVANISAARTPVAAS